MIRSKMLLFSLFLHLRLYVKDDILNANVGIQDIFGARCVGHVVCRPCNHIMTLPFNSWMNKKHEETERPNDLCSSSLTQTMLCRTLYIAVLFI